MPIKRCQNGNRPGFKWGDSGTCYTYMPGNSAERNRARRKARQQGKAIEASKRSNKS